MIYDLLLSNLTKNQPLNMVGDCAFILPKSKNRVHIIHNSDYISSPFKFEINFYNEKSELFYTENSFSGGEFSYNLSWSSDERFFAISYISQWYEDLYFIDVLEKKIIHEISGHKGEDGTRAVAFYGNTAVILPTLNYESGISDLKLFNCETREIKTILSSEEAIYNNLVIEDFVVSSDSKYLFVRSNLYVQHDIHSKEDVVNSKTLGLAFENLFSIIKGKTTFTCIDMETLVKENILKTVSFIDEILNGSKLLIQNINENIFNLFCVSEPNKPIVIDISTFIFKQTQLFQPIKLSGNFNEGYSLDIHTVTSKLTDNGSFITERTKLGQLLYEYKYCNNRNAEDELTKIIVEFLDKLLIEPCLGNIRRKKVFVVIPIPPSNTQRPYQPVYELVKRIFNPFKLTIDTNYLHKKATPELKSIEDLDSRKEVLKNAFSTVDKRYKGKSVILFDDLFRSGETLNAATKILKEHGEVAEVFVLTITKTRTKR